MELAMNAPAPTLGAFQRAKGRPFVEGLLMLWLAYLNKVLNLRRNMTDEQIEMCAIEINNEFYMLKMSDLTYIFKKIIGGEYGEFYESISIQKVLTWFRQYFDERCELAEQGTIRQHADFNSVEEFNYSNNIRRIFEGAKKSGK
jgi:hypothetical protein